ncbi:MAG: 1-acyl-sn-glycerol-3-phosphate acyltransferase [Myxococcota bacterium]
MIPPHVHQRRWRWARSLVRGAVGPWARVRVPLDGAEHLPTRGPALVVSNHRSYADTLWLASHLPPFVLCGPKPRLMRDPLRRAFVALANGVPDTGEAEWKADVAELLSKGEIVLTYPEGGRRVALDELRPWASEAALSGMVPVFPIAHTGTRLVAGPALAPEGTPEALTARLRQALVDLGAPC